MGAFKPGSTLVHVAGRVFGEEEKRAVIEWAEGDMKPTADWNHAQLEKRLAARCGVKHAILVNSGSSANLLAVLAATERSKQEPGYVVTAGCGFPTTVAPIIQAGHTPAWVDVGPDGNAGYYSVEAALLTLGKKARGVILAHTLGQPYMVEALRRLCAHQGVWLVEDCCDAFGATVEGGQVGTFGDAATLSFYPAHHMTTGEGGAVLTQSDEVAAIVRSLRDWGRDCYCGPGCDNTCGKRFAQQHGSLPEGYDHKYVYTRVGYNLKMTEVQAAIGMAQIAKVDSFIARRRATWSYYRDRLDGIPHLRMPRFVAGASPFGFLLHSPHRDAFVAGLEARRIQTRPLFAGNLTRHPAFQGKGRVMDRLDGADALMRGGFWIGVYPGVTDEQREWVVQSMREIASAL